MTEDYAGILIHILPRDAATGVYRVDARLSDGSEFLDQELRLDLAALRRAEHAYDPVAYGMMLFDALFTGKIRRAYDKITGVAEAQTGGRVRVRLQIDPGAAELHALPWERIYHTHRGQEVALAASGLTPFSRYTGLEMAEPRPLSARTIRLLVAVANPEGAPLEPIDVEGEVTSLHEVLSYPDVAGGDAGRGAVRFQLAVLPGRSGLTDEARSRLLAAGVELIAGPATPESLLRHLPRAHVLHLLCHGSFERAAAGGEGRAVLHLEDECGGWRRWPDVEIVAALARLPAQPHLISLTACESARRPEGSENPFVGLAPKLVQAGIPAVLAMQDRVPMSLARRLTADFYRLLLLGGVIDRALNDARSLVFQADAFEWSIPVLFMRLPEGRLLADLPEPGPVASVPVPPAAPQLVGRSQVLDRLAREVAQVPLLALHGLPGVGKTALALALASHPDLIAAFPQGRAWVALGPQADLFAALGQLLAQFGQDAGSLETVEQRADRLRAVTQGRRWLLVLDDVWQVVPCWVLAGTRPGR